MQDNPGKEKITVTPQGWLALIIMLCMFSGLFGNFDGSLKFLRALDLNVLIGSFGKIGEGGLNYMGAGGSGVRDGFLFALSLAPATIFCMAIIEVFSKMGVMEAFQKAFTPILKPLLGISGACGLPFVNSLNSSDIAAVLTKQIHDNGQMTDDERTILVSFMYPSSAPITNMISTQAPVLPIAVMALGPMILILVFCKLVGANIMRFIIVCNNKKAKAKEAA